MDSLETKAKAADTNWNRGQDRQSNKCDQEVAKMGAGEGGGGGGGGGGHQDIEEKFKKEISKEMANLKEFLIQQVGDI